MRASFLPALGVGAALSAMLFASRLPVTLDFILPRRAGWPLFALAHEILSRSGPRQAFSVIVTLALLGALAQFGWRTRIAVRGRAWTIRQFLTSGFLLAFIVLLLRWSFGIWLEVSQKVWFPFGALNVLEPIANLIFCSGIVWCAMVASFACLSQRPSAQSRIMLLWAAANAVAAIFSFSVYGAWSAPSARASHRRLFVVLTEEEGRPAQAAYDLPVAVETRLMDGVYRLKSLRELYEVQAKLMDPSGLRNVLMLGVKHNDDLARSLLLEHLSVAPPSPEALGALGALADETVHRIGAIGASRIALAYAHLGDAAQAALWARRGSVGARGIPVGLLDLSGGGALKPGRISGRVDGLKPLTVGLYRKSNPAAPYLLDAAGLVASVEADSKGRFSFRGLTAGRYYLALAYIQAESRRTETRVSGHLGDIVLSARKPSLDLPPLMVKLTSR